MSKTLILILMGSLCCLLLAHASSQEQSNSYHNVYEYVTCETTVQLQPSSTQELAAAIKGLYSKASAGQVVKVRPTRNGFGSSASFPCPLQPGSSLPSSRSSNSSGKPPIIAGVLLPKMNKVLTVDKAAYTMKVQGQMLLSELFAAATAAGMSPPPVMPAWAELSLAGIMAASAHGSGRNMSSVICDIVTEITFVDGQGVVHVVPRHSAAGRGLCSGLGLLGIITELTLQMGPTSHMTIDTWHLRNDATLWQDVQAMLRISPRLLVLWRPDVKKYSGYLLKEVPASQQPADSNAACSILAEMRPPDALSVGILMRFWQADIRNEKVLLNGVTDILACASSPITSVGQAYATSKGLPVFNGTGLTNKVQAVECGSNCPWTSPFSHLTIQDMEFTFNLSRLPAWINDVRRINDMDLQPTHLEKTRCLPPGFYVLRFGSSSADLLSTAGDLEDPVYVQQITTRSKMAGPTPSKYQWVQEAYEQLTLCKYNGRPHWGKCADRSFTHAAPGCSSIADKYGSRMTAMLQLQQQYDPMKMFEPELFGKMLSQQEIKQPGCALDRTCYCSADVHCPPGFICAPSKAFPEYKVCKPPKFA